MMNDSAPELSRRKRVARGAFKNIEGVVKKAKNTRLCAYLSHSAFFPALAYQRLGLYKCRMSVQWHHSARYGKDDAWNSLLHTSAEWAPEFTPPSTNEIQECHCLRHEIRWAGHVMRYRDDRWTTGVTVKDRAIHA
ncbi:unnamed protein product [Haemonchus placei]|uniref:Uncharacterized protein n=1 Tax=Haemonchus placei TaxID=6290 RepID=A0A0N4WRG5_HAEPC|nr:unnamed protein product [Haemonchus placei]